MNLLSLRLSYETDISCSVLPAALKKKKYILKSFYFSVSSSGITQLHMIELSSFQGNILVTDPTRRDETRRGHAAVWGVWRYASNYYWLNKPIQCYILVRQIQVECHTILHIAELKSTQGWQERAQRLNREAKNWIYKNLHSHICNLSTILGGGHTLKKYLKWIKTC